MKKIYIVDDDRNIVESIRIVLEAHGYAVAAQYDEKDVVANLAAQKADAVILDVMFPENPDAGFEIARQLRGDQRTAKVPILMLSAINEKGVYAGTFSNKDRDDSWLPINQFIEKPIKPKQLLQILEAALKGTPQPKA
ncbi:MAG: response regulator [Elusimicrobia bacterium]|nr:response regulator [Elusimicrobiota bacterium]